MEFTKTVLKKDLSWKGVLICDGVRLLHTSKKFVESK